MAEGVSGVVGGALGYMWHSRDVLEVSFGVPKLDPVDESSKCSTLLQRALVVASEVLGDFLGGGGGGITPKQSPPQTAGSHLMEVEHAIGYRITSYHCGGPQLLHKEHLISQVEG